jgi:hypothetical protein
MRSFEFHCDHRKRTTLYIPTAEPHSRRRPPSSRDCASAGLRNEGRCEQIGMEFNSGACHAHRRIEGNSGGDGCGSDGRRSEIWNAEGGDDSCRGARPRDKEDWQNVGLASRRFLWPLLDISPVLSLPTAPPLRSTRKLSRACYAFSPRVAYPTPHNFSTP